MNNWDGRLDRMASAVIMLMETLSDPQFSHKFDFSIVGHSGKYSKRRSEHREWSTVVKISIPPPSFKPVSMSLSRSLVSKTPKQVFFNPINIF